MIRAGGLRGYHGLMRSLGVEPDPVLAQFRIAPDLLADEDALIPLRATVQLLEFSANLVGCQDLGLRLAQNQDIGILGPLAVAMQNSPTVSDALLCASRYLFVQSPGIALDLIPADAYGTNTAELRFEILLPGVVITRQAMDLSLGVLHRILQRLARDQYDLRAVSIPHSPLASLSAYGRYFGAPVRVAERYGALHIGARTLNASVQAVNDQLRQMAADYLNLRFPRPGQSLSARVRLVLVRTLGTAQSQKNAVAQMLAMHPRTLQRRLDEEGVKFEQLREEVRKEAALRYLRGTRMPLSQVADLLGLSEQSALTRCCRRWFGATPSAIRTGAVCAVAADALPASNQAIADQKSA